MLIPRLLAGLALLLLTSPLTAQHADSVLSVGVQVRVTSPRWQWEQTRALFVAAHADSLVLDRPGAPGVRLALSDVESFQVLVQPDRSKQFARRGAIVGGLLGIAVAKLYLDWTYDNDEWNALGALIVGTPAGILLGSAYGAVRGQERWRNVPMSELRTIQPQP